MKPICRWRCSASASSSSDETSSPSRRYVPAVGRSSRPSTFSNVDLPDPDGPMIEMYSPGWIVRSTWSSARTTSVPTLYSRQMPRSSIMRLAVALFGDCGCAVAHAGAIDRAHDTLAGGEPADDLGEFPVRDAGLDGPRGELAGGGIEYVHLVVRQDHRARH